MRLIAHRSLALPILFVSVAYAQYVPQGTSLSPTGGTDPQMGYSAAISADGNTAVFGAFGNNNYTGGAVVFVRSNGVWSQQGPILIGSPSVGQSYQGYSVAISADGNTVLFGGPYDSNYLGGAWVFTRSGTTWSQQAELVTPTAGVQGQNVALSSDGNTAIVGSNGVGGLVYTRSNGVWTKLTTLTTPGANGSALGNSVAISGDGKTVVLGGPFDNNYTGAAWVFTLTNGQWAQQGGKLTGTNPQGTNPEIGREVAVSNDGNTLAIAAYEDNGYYGAVWVFTRDNNGVWTQQGDKLAGAQFANLGRQLNFSADGNTLAVGAPGENQGHGAVYLYRRSNGAWSLLQKVTANNGGGMGAGAAISADGTTVVGSANNYNLAWFFGHPPFFTGEYALGNSIYYLSFPNSTLFGYYSYLAGNWIYHIDMGYLYVSNTTGPDTYLYDSATGHWWYTTPALFPYLYDFNLHAWLFYFPDTHNPGHYTTNPRYFANTSNSQIIPM